MPAHFNFARSLSEAASTVTSRLLNAYRLASLSRQGTDDISVKWRLLIFPSKLSCQNS